MNDITELTSIGEDREVGEVNEDSVMVVGDQFSKSTKKCSDIESDKSMVIETVGNKNNFYQHEFQISSGSKGSILNKLYKDTKTGSIRKRIKHAKHENNNMIEYVKNFQDKVKFTHFISIPTNTIVIKDNFTKFKNEVLESCDMKATRFDEGMFQKPEKLHLTICMLHLLEDSDQQKAIDALNHCKKEIIDPILNENGPINVEFKGLKCMNNNYSKARILYINVHEETGSLQKMSDAISNYFIQKGLSTKERDNVNLHLTVVNTFYLKKIKPWKKHFDANNFLNDYKDINFGNITLSTLHLSKLAAKSPDGYYQATSKIEF